MVTLKPARHGTVTRFNTGCRCDKCTAVPDKATLSASEHAKQWRATNVEARRAYKAQWESTHPEIVRLSAWATEQRRRELPPTVETVEYARILLADSCSHCGGPGGGIDHIIPQSCGGGGDWDNLTATCGSCNSQKYNKPLLAFMLAKVG